MDLSTRILTILKEKPLITREVILRVFPTTSDVYRTKTTNALKRLEEEGLVTSEEHYPTPKSPCKQKRHKKRRFTYRWKLRNQE